MLIATLFIALAAVMWRARGSGFWGHVSTDTEARIAYAGVMGVALTALTGELLTLVLIPLLYAFETPAVSPYASLAINGDNSLGQVSQKNDPPIDWIMGKLKLPTATVMQRRIFGTVGISLRLAFLAPALLYLAAITGNYWVLALLAPLPGLGYFIAGFIRASDQRATAEWLAGGGLGAVMLASIGG